jgi:cytochrome P450
MMQATSTAVATPQGPPARFITGHLNDFRADPLGFLTRTARQYGDFVPYTLFGRPTYLVNSPEIIESLLTTRHREFIKSIGLRRGLWRRLIGNGLSTSEGDFWVRQRRLAQPAFHRQRIAAYANVMVAYTERSVGSWIPGEIRDVHQDMMRLTLEIAAKTLFDAEIAGEAGEAGAALELLIKHYFPSSKWTLMAFIGGVLPTPGSIRARNAIRRLERIGFRAIAERRERGQDRGDLLSMLLHARDEDGSQMTDGQLRDEMMTFLFAGHETTAIALSWTWYLLSQHPEVEAKLHAELETALGGRAAAIADLPRLGYAEQVVKEAMRLYPPAWMFGRETTAACEIAGHRVPKGAQLVLSPWVTHRDPRFWEEAEVYRPERWSEGAPPKFAYFPFGGGPHGCIGQSFALMEAVLILATIAQRFRLTLAPGHRVEPWPTLALRPRYGMRMVLGVR